MRLAIDEIYGIYVWVDENDHDTELSPHFDYEEDAHQWYNQVKLHILKKETPK